MMPNPEWEQFRDRSVRRDCLTAVLAALFVAFGLVAVLVATSIR